MIADKYLKLLRYRKDYQSEKYLSQHFLVQSQRQKH